MFSSVRRWKMKPETCTVQICTNNQYFVGEMMNKSIPQTGLPHNRISKLIDEGGEITPIFKESLNRWINSLLLDDDIQGVIDNRGEVCKAIISCKERGVFAGKLPINFLLNNWIQDAKIEYKVDDGDVVKVDDELMILSMSTEQVLKFERVILNIIGRLSGIATATNSWIKRSPIPIASTRKTTWGLLDKWAVHVGGGLTHRLSRKDALMIKENDVIGSNLEEEDHMINIINTIEKIKDDENREFVVIEVRKSEEAIKVAEKWTMNNNDAPLTIMLDNMNPNTCYSVIKELEKNGLRNTIIIEASGGIILQDIDSWGVSGVDVISTSAIHRGTSPLDISLLIVQED